MNGDLRIIKIRMKGSPDSERWRNGSQPNLGMTGRGERFGAIGRLIRKWEPSPGVLCAPIKSPCFSRTQRARGPSESRRVRGSEPDRRGRAARKYAAGLYR